MRHPVDGAIERNDRMLGRAGLAEAGRLYAGDLPPSDPLASALLGDLRGLPPSTVLTGTHDILNADAHRFAALAGPAGIDVELHEEPGQQHGYPLFPTPEAARAVALVVERLRRA